MKRLLFCLLVFCGVSLFAVVILPNSLVSLRTPAGTVDAPLPNSDEPLPSIDHELSFSLNGDVFSPEKDGSNGLDFFKIWSKENEIAGDNLAAEPTVSLASANPGSWASTRSGGSWGSPANSFRNRSGGSDMQPFFGGGGPGTFAIEADEPEKNSLPPTWTLGAHRRTFKVEVEDLPPHDIAERNFGYNGWEKPRSQSNGHDKYGSKGDYGQPKGHQPKPDDEDCTYPTPTPAPPSVPDGGKTVTLLGLTLLAIALARKVRVASK